MNKFPCVVFDAGLINTGMRGMGVYINELLRNVKLQSDLLVYVVFSLGSTRAQRESLSVAMRTNGLNARILYIPLPKILTEQLMLPFICYFLNAGLVCSGNTSPLLVARNKLLLIIHDAYFMKDLTLMGIQCRSIKKRAGRLYRRFCLARFRGYRDVDVVTVSEFAKRDLLKEFDFNERNVYVVPNGVDLRCDHQAEVARSGSLLVSGKDPQKNFLFFLSAIQKLPSDALARLCPIKVAGLSREDYPVSSSFNVEIEFTGHIPHAQLLSLYEKSEFFIVPSLYESFCIPAVEALSRGCRVAVSRTGAIPEVCGDLATYFDPRSEASFCEAIQELTAGAEARSQEVINQRLRCYTWVRAGASFGGVLDSLYS